jgi:ParB family chromosome partitioning protein
MAELGRMAAEEGWSVREIEGRVQKQRAPSKRKPARATAERDPTERRLEEELQRILGTAVKLKTGGGASGRIEIPFYGAEDFERVFELVTGKTTADVVS